MTTKTKIILGLVLVSILVGISVFFYYRGKNSVKVAEVIEVDTALVKVAEKPIITVQNPIEPRKIRVTETAEVV